MAKQTFELAAEFREDQGKGASRRLRREGKVPAVLYGGHQDPRALALDHDKLIHQLDNEAFYSSILTLKVGDTEQDVVLKDLQRHPAKRQVLHADFQRLVAGETFTLSVPLHFVGEEEAPGVKTGGGIASRMVNEIEIICLPRNLPEYIEVDVSELELDDSVMLSDVNAPEGVEIVDLTPGRENNRQIFAIHRPAREEVEEEEGEEIPEGEVPTVSDEEQPKEED
ncbi:MAG: 50S ribosomal protein L25/general stress protein Ctc [Gammaproteobacteria bacterium]|nr:50S ribosomal protein L25/general stress protein Ctc [Gammaproteobacteria bacterium]